MPSPHSTLWATDIYGLIIIVIVVTLLIIGIRRFRNRGPR